MVSQSELSLDCKPHNYPILLKSFGDQSDQTQKLEEYLSRLEEERLKIDAFKRELPLCMQLLTNAMEDSRQQLQTCKANQLGQKPVLEEFIPIKYSNSEESENVSEKANWMTTAQLWSRSNEEIKQQTHAVLPTKNEHSFGISSKLNLDNKQRNGGAFLPFTKDRNPNPNPNSMLRILPELALTSAEVDDKKSEETKRESGNKSSCGGTLITREQQEKGGGNQAEEPGATSTTQAHRKARRCWSPDLHRRFVNALQKLGGSQVATPKQIRELMKVDGLTNDEVKSHLQKYRLHTRRPSPSPQTAGTPAPQLVVLGGIWVPPEYATAAGATHASSPVIYGAHPASHVTAQYCVPPLMPQDFYPATSHQLHHTLDHHQHHMHGASSQSHSSPESDLRGDGDVSESVEDRKSESSSWKRECGENGGERKGLAYVRDEGEESNGSEITLKF